MQLVSFAFAVVFASAVAGGAAGNATLKRGATYTGEATYGGGQARQRAPLAFSCDRNHLTSYTGVVIRYARAVGSTTLRIKTDDDTTESVTVKHAGTDDPSPLFQFQGEPFTAAHWSRIERSKGVLLPNTRAAAWVCDDGQVMVDWGVRSDVR